MRHWAILLRLLPLLLLVSSPRTVALAFSPYLPFTPSSPVVASAEMAEPPVTRALAELVPAAELIVRGRVRDVQSFWSFREGIIESAVTLDVGYLLAGQADATVMVRTPGGYLPATGLGMVSTHGANFIPGEEVLLLLWQGESGWQLVEGAAGKFQIEGETIVNHDLAMRQPLAELMPTLEALLVAQGIASQLPGDWQRLEMARESAMLPVMNSANDTRKWATPHAAAAFSINLNTAQVGDEDGDATAFRQAILAAAASWSGVASADFALTYTGETNATRTGYNGMNEVLFMAKGPKERAAAAQVWYTSDQTIVEADIWINDDYQWNATGAPASNEVDLQSALLHEFGHWLILGHVPHTEAVMFARLTAGTLKRALQLPDVAGISAIYPR